MTQAPLISKLFTNPDELCEELKGMHIIAINEQTGQPIPLSTTKGDITYLSNLLLAVASQDKINFALVKEIYRCLRNCTVLNKTIQNEIADNENIITITKTILHNPQNLECLNMILLFLTNLAVDNTNTGSIIWCNYHSELETLLKTHSNKAAALIYNVLYKNLDLVPSFEIVYTTLELLAAKVESEYLIFLLELFIKRNAITEYYPQLTTESRVVLLEELRELMIKDEHVISNGFLKVIVDDFKKKSDCILKTVVDYLKSIEPYEVSLLLDIIANASSKEQHLLLVQSDRSLLINCAFLLRSMQGIGKEGKNCFTTLGKLSEALAIESEVMEHPAFGFKAALIRVLGNLAWKCRSNQDELRELDCITLLLDCCNIDARNPLIIQWVIFSMRNLCENNLENQKIIASLTKQGVIDSATLSEFGLTLNDDETNKICIVPLPNKQ